MESRLNFRFLIEGGRPLGLTLVTLTTHCRFFDKKQKSLFENKVVIQ
jgi:hypothetical protein